MVSTRAETRSKANSQLSSPPAVPEQMTKITAKTDVEATPEHAVYRQPSLIPAYRFDDSIDDLDIDKLVGTPFSCEIRLAKKKTEKNREKKKRQKANKVKKIEQIKEEDEFFTPISTAASPPSPTAATTSAQKEEEKEDSTDIAAFMEAMSLGKETTSTSIPLGDNSSSKEGSHEDQVLRLKGVPTPTGSHIHFEGSHIRFE